MNKNLQEKLRNKILTRLSKEGSSADEPTNIPLSDYSSDEGDSSSSCDEGKDSLCDLEGPCCQTLRVPPSSPVLVQKKSTSGKKVNIRTKHRRRAASFAKSKLLTRSVMDIPTTDPGSDFPDYYTTEDECETDYDIEGNLITKSSTSRISKILRGDIRKSSSISYDTILMPPELIVTKVTDDNQFSFTDLPFDNNKTSVGTKTPPTFTQNIIREFPPINKKSWHNFNRCMSTMKIRNWNCDNETTAENLQFKLSLKKQIWTGTQSESTFVDFSRPLSFGVQSSATAGLTFNKSSFYDCETLLTACSQKLSEWQECGEQQRSEKIILAKSMARQSKKSKAESRKEKSIAKKEDQKTVTSSEPSSKDNNQATHKIHRRRSTFHKIVETADIISHLAKNTKSSSAKIRKPFLQQSVTSTEVVPKIQKFKTSGIVATAAIQPKMKHRRASAAPQTPLPLQVNTDSEQENLRETSNIKFPLRRATKKSLKLLKESASRKLEKAS